MARECKFHELKPTGISCPECRSGTLEPAPAPARGRYGPIYKSTTKKNAVFSLQPTGELCSYPR